VNGGCAALQSERSDLGQFAGAPRPAKILLVFMFVFFLLGLCAVALAPLY